jgi:hypothetical protein
MAADEPTEVPPNFITSVLDDFFDINSSPLEIFLPGKFTKRLSFRAPARNLIRRKQDFSGATRLRNDKTKANTEETKTPHVSVGRFV